MRFDSTPGLGSFPIETLNIPTDSRDELPPIVAGLKWLFTNNSLRDRLLGVLETEAFPSKNKGRRGMDLWHVLVLGVIRLGLDMDYDRLTDMANHHELVRKVMGVYTSGLFEEKVIFKHRTIHGNVSRLTPEILEKLNEIIVLEGGCFFSSKNRGLSVKVDSYVLESNIHFPTDLNLLWDAGRKCLDLVIKLQDEYPLPGWRKIEDWRDRLRKQFLKTSKTVFGGGANKEERSKKEVTAYLKLACGLMDKLRAIPEQIPATAFLLPEFSYCFGMLYKHVDLVGRRLLFKEQIPHNEKVHSIFEPHVEWINKGKKHPSVELGHRLLIATDQNDLIVDYKVMFNQQDIDQNVPTLNRLLRRFGFNAVDSLSFDRGFSSKEDKEFMKEFVPNLIMPKKGKKSKKDREEENAKTFRLLRKKHAAVESNINCVEHHGLNRCPDKGAVAFERYVGLGVMAYNLHKIGKRLLEYEAAKAS